MVPLLNILAGWVLIFALVMRGYIDAMARGERPAKRPFRIILFPSAIALVMLVGLSAWMLVMADYILPAILLVVHVWWFFARATAAAKERRGRPASRPPADHDS